MPTHTLLRRLRHGIHRSRLLQIGLIAIFWLAGEAFVRFASLPVPGGIVGMVLALVLLTSHRVSLRSLQRGADWFLAEMLLFFVPVVLAVVDHREFLGLLGLKILIVILAGTTAVMAVTACTVDLCYRWRVRHGSADPLLG
jgi:holin-like protein